MANQTLTPELQAALAALTGANGQQDMADTELAKAAALRRQPMVRAGGKWGGIAAGLANAVNGIDAAITGRMGMDQKKAAYAQQQAGQVGLQNQYGKIGADEQALEAYNKLQGQQELDGPAPQLMIAPTGSR